MTAFRGPLLYSHYGHPLDRAPLALVNKINLHGAGDGYASDFFSWEGPIAAGTVGRWTLGGGTGAATITITAADLTGTIRLTDAATAGGNANLELRGQWHYTVGKRLWCFARIAVSDANDCLPYFGLALPGHTDWVAALPAEGIFFEKAETATVWDFHVRDNSTSTERANCFGTGNYTVEDGVYQVLGFVITEKGHIIPYRCSDAAQAASFVAGTHVAAATANIPDDTADEFSLYFSQETGNGEADYMDIDWVLVAQER